MGSLFSFVSGLLFGVGLIASGMTDPAKVQGFLDPLGVWDPSLAFVMVGGILVGIPAFRWAARHKNSWSGEPISIPNSRVIDARLVIGGLLFGTGWGLGGFCPGPALVSMSTGLPDAILFVATMLLGMVFHDKVIAKFWK